MLSTCYRILLIEDDSAATQTIAETLRGSQDCAFELVRAESLQAGWPKLATENFDALLLGTRALDGRGLDGVTAVQSQFSCLPIVLLLSKQDETLRKRVVQAGAADYLIKETLSAELLERIISCAIHCKRAENRVRGCEQRFHDLFENAKDILFTLDLAGNITSLNKSAEEVMGWPRSEVLQRSIKKFVAPEHSSVCSEMMQRILKEEPLQHFEINMLRKDGRTVTLETSGRLMYADGKREGIQGIARDITERRHLENVARRSQKLEAVGRLSGGLAHDFNNLLCVINGHIDLLSETLEPGHTAIKSVTEIRKAAGSAASLTRQLLAFGRKQVLHPRILDVNGVVVETKKLLVRLIGEHIEFFAALDPRLGHVMADPVQIEQVIVNLVLNACDAMPQGGKLIIETSNVELDESYRSKRLVVPAGQYVQVVVTDTGCGMGQETQGRIFEPFYTTKELGKGTGLGLASVYGIVKQSGGFIWVYSEPGCGTSFRIYFPRVDKPVTHASSSQRRADVRKGTETVLLVEDAEPLRALAREFLKGSGYAVLEAENGKGALQIASSVSTPIHLLLTDVIMPVMGGKQLAEELARLHPATKVLYMSGYPCDGIVQSGVLATGVAHLEKPFNRETLLRKVRQVLDGELETE